MRIASGPLAVGLLTGLLASCTTTQRWYPDPPRPRDTVAWLVTNDSQALRIETINGYLSSTIAERHELLPDWYSIKIRSLRMEDPSSRTVNQTVLLLEAEAGHTYRLRRVQEVAGDAWIPVIEDAGPIQRPERAPALAGTLQRNCLAGKPSSCVQLGAIYEHGGTELGWDERRAAELYRQACAVDDHVGCLQLARLQETGHGVPRDETAAANLFQHVCEAGEVVACTRLGHLLREGRGRMWDERRASELFERACDAGEPEACHALGAMARGDSAGYNRAADLFKKACDGGEPRGCTELGRLREYGLGVEQDERAAAELYDKACSAGSALGCANFATLLVLGKEPVRARVLFRRACARGVASACISLQALDESSQYNRPQEPVEKTPEAGGPVSVNQPSPPDRKSKDFRISARGEVDLLHLGFLPAVSGEIFAGSFSVVTTIVLRIPPALRLEGRLYPFQWSPVRPYGGVSGSLFFDVRPGQGLSPTVGVRAVLGAEVQVSDGHLFLDLAWEHFLNPAPEYEPDSVLLALGAGWRF